MWQSESYECVACAAEPPLRFLDSRARDQKTVCGPKYHLVIGIGGCNLIVQQSLQWQSTACAASSLCTKYGANYYDARVPDGEPA